MMRKIVYCLCALLVLIFAPSVVPCKPCERPLTTTASITVDISKTDAWQILQDFSLPHNYVPNLEKTEIVSESSSGLGAHRRVYNDDGSFIEETIVQWNEGTGFVIKLHKGTQVMSPFSFAQFRYELESLDENSCRIHVSMDTKMTMGYLGLALQKWAIKPVVTDNLIAVVAGMKSYYETGERVGEDSREALKHLVTVGD